MLPLVPLHLLLVPLHLPLVPLHLPLVPLHLLLVPLHLLRLMARLWLRRPLLPPDQTPPKRDRICR